MDELTQAERDALLALIHDNPHAALLGEVCKERKVPLFLCGGALRDALSNSRKPKDLDLFVECDAAVCQEILSIFVSKKSPRAKGDLLVDIDHTHDVSAHVSQFDFTCNALAFSVDGTTFLDPTGRGLTDARARQLNPTSHLLYLTAPRSHLRLFRLALSSGFSIPDEVLALTENYSELLALSDPIDSIALFTEFLDLLMSENEELISIILKMRRTRTLQKIVPETVALFSLEEAKLIPLLESLFSAHNKETILSDADFLSVAERRIDFDKLYGRQAVFYRLSKLSLFRYAALLTFGFLALQRLNTGKKLDKATFSRFISQFDRFFSVTLSRLRYDQQLVETVRYAGTVARMALRRIVLEEAEAGAQEGERWASAIALISSSF